MLPASTDGNATSDELINRLERIPVDRAGRSADNHQSAACTRLTRSF
jgi:hypothetical protein